MRKATRKPLTIGVIEELRRKGYSQSEIARMHGVTRQAVTWHKVEYNGHLTPREVVNKHWPWDTNVGHSKASVYMRLRDYGEFVATGGKTMSEDKLRRLLSWLRFIKENSLVVEFDPEIPPEPGIAPFGGFAYRERRQSDGDLLIRVNEHTNLTPEGRMIWRLNPVE